MSKNVCALIYACIHLKALSPYTSLKEKIFNHTLKKLYRNKYICVEELKKKKDKGMLGRKETESTVIAILAYFQGL